jgi:hypothetical protein
VLLLLLLSIAKLCAIFFNAGAVCAQACTLTRRLHALSVFTTCILVVYPQGANASKARARAERDKLVTKQKPADWQVLCIYTTTLLYTYITYTYVLTS